MSDTYRITEARELMGIIDEVRVIGVDPGTPGGDFTVEAVIRPTPRPFLSITSDRGRIGRITWENSGTSFLMPWGRIGWDHFWPRPLIFNARNWILYARKPDPGT